MAKPQTKYKPGDEIYLFFDAKHQPRQIVEVIPAKYKVRVGNELIEVEEIEMADEPNGMTILRGQEGAEE